MSDLKDCPFCGGKATSWLEDNNDCGVDDIFYGCCAKTESAEDWNLRVSDSNEELIAKQRVQIQLLRSELAISVDVIKEICHYSTVRLPMTSLKRFDSVIAATKTEGE